MLAQLSRQNKPSFPKVLTEVPEWGNVGQALTMVLGTETELLKSASLEPSRPREGREWPSKGKEASGHQTGKSHRCLCNPAPRRDPLTLDQMQPLL